MRPHPAAAVILSIAFAAPHARGHAGLFRPDELRIAPDNPDHMLVRSDVWGFIETRDRGRSWQWFCAETAFGDSVTISRRPLELLPGGRALVSSSAGALHRASDSLCQFEPVAFFAEPERCGTNACLFYDITLEPARAHSALVLTAGTSAAESVTSRLWRSLDYGETWSPAGSALPGGVLATGVRPAPSDSTVFYAAGIQDGAPNARVLLASADDGVSWSSTSVAVPTDVPFLLTARIAAVHPQDPAIAVMWLDYDSGGAEKAPDVLLLTRDGGATLTTLFTGSDDLPGCVFSPDGARLFVGGASDGLWSTAVEDLRAGVSESFELVDPAATWALAWTDQGLFAGRDEYAAASTVRMTLGVSRDDGAHFDPALVICDVSLAACPTESTAGEMCPDLFYGDNNFRADHQLLRCASRSDAGIVPDEGNTSAEGGVETGNPGNGASSGCGCRFTRKRTPHLAWFGFAMAALVATRRYVPRL